MSFYIFAASESAFDFGDKCVLAGLALLVLVQLNRIAAALENK